MGVARPLAGAGPGAVRFWVDIANSPHATLFRPLLAELAARGHDAVVTTWDRAQTEQLARSFWPDAIPVGAGADSGILAKGLRIRRRARALAGAVSPHRPGVALGHNSYAQLLAARRLGLRSITMMDYEHQPANHLAFRLAARVLLPQAYPEASARRQGASGKVMRYPGFKEEVTFADFVPDPSFRRSVGVGAADLLVALRPPPEGALYHRGGNALFDLAVRRVAASGATGLLSPRDGDQARRFEAFGGNVRVLERAVDGANLLFHSDLVIGAGGTMTREACILKTPSYTLFAGRLAAVDGALIDAGRLIRITSPDELESIVIARKPPGTWHPSRERVEQVATLIERAATDR
jgi:predicted glycosyltransferase